MARRLAIIGLTVFLGLVLCMGPSQAEEEQPRWQTNDDYEPVGDPNAKKGGMLRDWWTSYPPTLRTEGPNSNLTQLSQVHGYLYESLVQLHSTTLEFMPALAKEWAISEDKRTFWFRIDPRARWADGDPVTAHDVVATWEHLVDPEIKDPFANWNYSHYFEKPVALDDTTVRVHTKELNWRLFLYFGGMSIYKASEVSIPGEAYLEKYQWKLLTGTGPYYLNEDDLKKENSLTLTRRDDYWAANERWNTGMNNFDKIRWIVILDQELAFEKFKKGELDFYVVGKAQRWHEECDFDKIRMGWIQKRKIYNQRPIGYSGFVFNMRKAPFDDIRVRKAFSYLFNRAKLMEKLFFNEYEYIDSYYPGREWGNPNNEIIRYDPEKAAALLAEAGYSKRNEDGWLVGPDGRIFEITLEYGAEAWTRIHTVIKEDYENAGIKFNLKLLDWRTLLKKVEERNFTIHFQSWGAIIFPNPESSWGSHLADQKHNNNIPGFKSRKVDRLCKAYNEEFDRKRQVQIIRAIDGIIFEKHPYALGWYGPHIRILYWNKFGHPASYFSRVGSSTSIHSMWWFDPDKERALKEGMGNNTALAVGETVQRPWQGYGSVVDEGLKDEGEGEDEGEE